MDGVRRIIILGLDGMREFDHAINGAGFQQVVIVQMVEENVQPPFRVINLGLEGRWGAGLHPFHVRSKNFEDGLGLRRDMGSVTRSFTRVSLNARRKKRESVITHDALGPVLASETGRYWVLILVKEQLPLGGAGEAGPAAGEEAHMDSGLGTAGKVVGHMAMVHGLVVVAGQLVVVQPFAAAYFAVLLGWEHIG